MRQYSLAVFNHVFAKALPENPIKDLTGVAEDWTRSIRYPGGFWRGSFTMFPGVIDLYDAFDQWIGHHIVERANGLTSWEGFVAEMTIYADGSIRRKSVTEMWNAVQARYREEPDGDTTDTAFSTQDQSIERFGRKEQFLFMDGYAAATVAAGIDAELRDNAWPVAKGVGFGERGDTFLDVTVLGYAHTANWMFQQAGDGALEDVSDWIEDIVGTEFGLSADHGGAVAGAGDCQFLKVGKVTTNTLEAFAETSFPVRAWDVLANPDTGLTSIGIEDPDSAGDYLPAILYVDVGRLVHYEPINPQPRYTWSGGVLMDQHGVQVINPWLVRPAVVRDATYPVRRHPDESPFLDARDVLVQEVEVDWNGNVTLRPEAFSRAEILRAQAVQQQNYERYLESLELES